MINNPGLVSVIVSTYKRNNLLPGCIHAILSNEFVGELIVVHDGPSAEYLALATELKANPYYDRVIFVYTDSWAGRPAPARNYGIKLSRFSFIAFCDDDDIWSISHLSSSLDILSSNEKIDLVFHNPSIRPSTEKVSLSNLFCFNFLWQSSCVARVSLKIRRFFSYNESLSHKAIEDYMLWIRLVVNGAHIKYVNCPMVVYSESFDSIRASKIKTHLKILRAFFIEYGFFAAPMVVGWIALRLLYILFGLNLRRRSKAPSS
jgi:glycosyltransferase involved in cell wall biosynthesis